MVSRALKIWTAPLLFTLFIYSGIPVVRPVTNYLQSFMDLNAVLYGAGAVFVAGLIVLTLKSARGNHPVAAFLLILFSIAFIYTLTLPGQAGEKIHFFEYSVLAVLVHHSLSFEKVRLRGRYYAVTFLICTAVSCGDETLQYFYPDRVFDLFDILYNAIGSLFGIVYVIIRKEMTA